MNPILKLLLFPLAIIAAIAAGSIFAELKYLFFTLFIYHYYSNFLLYESKYSIDAQTVSWFTFAVNASALVGYVPSKFYRKFGPKKTILIGGALITIAHVVAAIVLQLELSKNVATVLLFIIGVLGGQGACIVFLTALGATLKMHSIVSTSLVNGIMFTYFLGSDTFHQALKYGIFSNFTLQQFLLVVAVLGALVYIACAIFFQKKAQKESSSKSLAKGMALKKTVSLYAAVLAAFLIMSVLLLISYQLNSYWGSRVLVVILAVNLLVPVISLSMVDQKNLSSMFSKPSETDKFLSSRGKNCSFKDARKKQEFWLFIFTFGIIIGIARMVDENATYIALYNSSNVEKNQRSFQIFEIVGSFTTGVILSLFRIHVSPYALLLMNTVLLIASQVLMFFVNISSAALFISVVLVAFISGSSFVLAGQVAHEDYGEKHFGKILGIFMTAGAFGLLIFDQLIFDQLYYWFSTQDGVSSYKSYGKWSNAIFMVTIVSSGLAFIMALGAYLKTRKSDGNKDKIAEFVKF
eukprot:403376522